VTVSVVLATGRGTRTVRSFQTAQEAQAWGIMLSNALILRFPYGYPPSKGLQIMVKDGRKTYPVNSAVIKATLPQAATIAKDLPGGAADRPRGRQRAESAPAEHGGDVEVFAFIIDFGQSPPSQTNVSLGQAHTDEEAQERARRACKALEADAKAKGYAGGQDQVRFMYSNGGSHRVLSQHADAARTTAFMRAYAQKAPPAAKRKPSRSTRPKPPSAPRPPRRPAAPEAKPVYWVWLEGKEPDKPTSKRRVSEHRLKRDADRAAAAEFERLYHDPNRQRRVGRKLRAVVRNEQGKLMSETPWRAVLARGNSLCISPTASERTSRRRAGSPSDTAFCRSWRP